MNGEGLVYVWLISWRNLGLLCLGLCEVFSVGMNIVLSMCL